jgi:hypothetical protein
MVRDLVCSLLAAVGAATLVRSFQGLQGKGVIDQVRQPTEHDTNAMKAPMTLWI